MNKVDIGNNMAQVTLPQIQLRAKSDQKRDNSQINTSCILNYLGIKGVGRPNNQDVKRKFNALPLLMYWDIYKSYYANKQEKIGVVIHNEMMQNINELIEYKQQGGTLSIYEAGEGMLPQIMNIYGQWACVMDNNNLPSYNEIKLRMEIDGIVKDVPITEIYGSVTDYGANVIYMDLIKFPYNQNPNYKVFGFVYNQNQGSDDTPKLKTFPLENIDQMREDILTFTGQAGAFVIGSDTIEKGHYAPYSLLVKEGDLGYSKEANQEGLGIKTYQSDLFNNWLNTESITGSTGVNQITAVDTSAGYFNIDTLNLANKVYNMLNRIAMSDGSYEAYLEATYGEKIIRRIENPVYVGGLSKELAFQEVISNAVANDGQNTQPLGTLAGRGVMTNKHKGGKIDIRVNEPSYVMGIVSLTPRVNYSQGNDWDCQLKTMNDFHKPALDEIGFQDLITEQMAWWDTEMNGADNNYVQNSAGKVPAWINYMTSIDRTYGNFADENQQMFMTLNRRYEQGENGRISDLTTYIDPSKFNHIFADTRLDAQNFWVQISIDNKVRRKMSAKVMPNL